MQIINNVIAILVIMFAGWLLYENTATPKVIERHITSIDTVLSPPDTVVVAKPIFIKEKAVHDTVWRFNVPAEKVVLDTTIKDSKVNIEYYFPPIDSFDVKIRLGEKVITKIVTEMKTVEVIKHLLFYEDHWFYTTALALIIILVRIIL